MRALALLLLAGCSSASIAPDPEARLAEPLTDGGAPAAEASAAAVASEAAAPAPEPRNAHLGESCAGTLGCEPSPYEGPLLLSWACYPSVGCAFRCDECPWYSDAGGGACQVAYEQTAPPVCQQLGGHCVAGTGLDGGAVSLCVK